MNKTFTNILRIIAFFVLGILLINNCFASGSINKTNIPFFKSKIDCFMISNNPADLYTDSLNIIINIPSLMFSGANNNISFDDINYYFGNKESKYLKDEDKQAIIGKFKNEGNFFANGNYSLFSLYINLGLNIGAVEVSVEDNLSGFMTFPTDLIDLAFNGNQPGRIYSFDKFDSKASWLRYYSLSYSLPIIHNIDKFSNSEIRRFQIGGALKYVQGLLYYSVEDVNSLFHTSQNDNTLKGYYNAEILTSFSEDFSFEYDYEEVRRSNNIGLFPTPSGQGFGFDIGASIEFKNNLFLSASLNNIGSITWDKNTAKHSLSGEVFVNDIFNEEQIDSLIDFSEMKSEPVGSFSTSLPSYLLLSAGYDISASLEGVQSFLIYANYFQGLNAQPGNSINPVIELRNYISFSDWLPYFSYGIRYDEAESFRFPILIGYSTPLVSINLSTFDVLSLVKQDRESPNYSFGFNMQFRIIH